MKISKSKKKGGMINGNFKNPREVPPQPIQGRLGESQGSNSNDSCDSCNNYNWMNSINILKEVYTPNENVNNSGYLDSYYNFLLPGKRTVVENMIREYLNNLKNYCQLLKIPYTSGYISNIFEEEFHIFTSIPLIPSIIMDPDAKFIRLPALKKEPTESDKPVGPKKIKDITTHNKKIQMLKQLLEGPNLREWNKQMKAKNQLHPNPPQFLKLGSNIINIFDSDVVEGEGEDKLTEFDASVYNLMFNGWKIVSGILATFDNLTFSELKSIELADLKSYINLLLSLLNKEEKDTKEIESELGKLIGSGTYGKVFIKDEKGKKIINKMQKFGDGLDDEDDESGDEDLVLSASLSRSRSSEGIKEKVKIDSISKIDFSQDIALEKIANSLAEINLKQSEIERLINSQDQQDLVVLERKKEILERKKEKLQNMQTNNNSINNLAKNYDMLGKNRKSATIDEIKGILARKRKRSPQELKEHQDESPEKAYSNKYCYASQEDTEFIKQSFDVIKSNKRKKPGREITISDNSESLGLPRGIPNTPLISSILEKKKSLVESIRASKKIKHEAIDDDVHLSELLETKDYLRKAASVEKKYPNVVKMPIPIKTRTNQALKPLTREEKIKENEIKEQQNKNEKEQSYKKSLCDFAISLTEFIKESLIQNLLSNTPGDVHVPVLSNIYYAMTDKDKDEIDPNNYCFYLQMEPLKLDGHDMITDVGFLSQEVKLDTYMSAKSEILTNFTKYKYMHADPKPDNCMFTGIKTRSNAKFIDFGFSSISIPYFSDEKLPVNIKCRPGAVRDEWIKRERKARNIEKVYNKYNDVWQEMTILYHTYSDQIVPYTVEALKILLTYVKFAHLDHAFTEVGAGTRYWCTLDCVEKQYVILDMIGEEDKKHFESQASLDDLITDCEMGIMLSEDDPDDGLNTLEEMKEEGSWDKTYGFVANYQIIDPLFDPNYYWEVLKFLMDRIKESEYDAKQKGENLEIDSIDETLHKKWRDEITEVILFIDSLQQDNKTNKVNLQRYRILRGTFNKSEKPIPEKWKNPTALEIFRGRYKQENARDSFLDHPTACLNLKQIISKEVNPLVRQTMMGGKFKKLKLKTLKRKNKNITKIKKQTGWGRRRSTSPSKRRPKSPSRGKPTSPTRRPTVSRHGTPLPSLSLRGSRTPNRPRPTSPSRRKSKK